MASTGEDKAKGGDCQLGDDLGFIKIGMKRASGATGMSLESAIFRSLLLLSCEVWCMQKH